MDILDDMGVSKLSAKVFFKVNYSKCPKSTFLFLLLLLLLLCFLLVNPMFHRLQIHYL